MKFKKIVLILAIIALVSTLAINTSFAASNEKITKWKMHATNTYTKEIVTIYEIYVMDDDYNSKSTYKIMIKKKYQNKFKIKSVNITYKYYGADYELDETIHKTYNGKKKNSITIKDSMKNLDLEKIAIEYYTKAKPKIESTNLLMNFNWKSTTQYYGKKSNIKVFEKGYNKIS